MRYYIVREGNQLILFDVSEDRIDDFEGDYLEKVIAEGNSIQEALLEFLQIIVVIEPSGSAR